MNIYGLTGRVGSGKTTLQNLLLKNTAIMVIDCDQEGHKILETEKIIQSLCAAFGEKIITATGQINRKKLGEIVFSNPEKLSQLNRIVHPQLTTHIQKLLATCTNSTVLIVGAILQELGLEKYCDLIITCDASDKHIMERTKEKFLKISPHQRTRIAYLESSDVIIRNNSEKQLKKSALWLRNCIESNSRP